MRHVDRTSWKGLRVGSGLGAPQFAQLTQLIPTPGDALPGGYPTTSRAG